MVMRLIAKITSLAQCALHVLKLSVLFRADASTVLDIRLFVPHCQGYHSFCGTPVLSKLLAWVCSFVWCLLCMRARANEMQDSHPLSQ
uniref:Putative secreted protein n=1 Tax=Ixodes scapularis TaxID=6945 RepID=A0A4D5RYJ3_IXOSC